MKTATTTTSKAMMTPGVMTKSFTFGPSMILIWVANERMGDSSGRRSGTVLRIEAKPRAKNIIAKVAMNGWTLKYWIRMPEARPKSPPMAIIRAITSQAFHPALIRSTPVTEVKAMTAPTDRSIPPVTMTKVSPTAKMIRWELLISRFETELIWRMRP